MSRLARENVVLWVNYHGTRRPSARSADMRSAISVLSRVARGPKRVDGSLTHFTPLVIPGVAKGPLSSFNRRAVVGQIGRVLRRVAPCRSQPVQLWSFAPDVDYLAGRFDEERCVYYCVDEFSEFDGVDAATTQARERALMRRADVVLVSSKPLYETKSRWHENAHHVPHGVDAEHFARALHPHTPLPDDVARLPRPVMGFFGLVHHWVDVDLIADVARRLPQASFVIIGNTHVDVGRLRKSPNVVLLGRRPYASLPAYCSAFDVGLIPFRQNELTRNVNPIKLREYLAAGLPVVSTPLPEVRRYEPEVTVAADADAFADACLNAARRSHHRDRVRRCRLVSGETWDAVVHRVSSIVMRPSRRPSMQQSSAPCTEACETSARSTSA
jgi:glycosyltransferase involved in cell wall biosynthesis